MMSANYYNAQTEDAIRPVETIYNGLRFRSRLETRWAMFFDQIGIEYEYEPEGFALTNGQRYLPDFRVVCYGTRIFDPNEKPFDLWIEVKGRMTEEDAEKIKIFAREKPVLILSDIPQTMSEAFCYADEHPNSFGLQFLGLQMIDGDWYGICPAAHYGKLYLLGADYYDEDRNGKDISLTEKAFQTARQARFEYEERKR